MQPQRGQYNNVLANDIYLVAFVKNLDYMTFDWWISQANLHKANFILQFFAKLSYKILVYKGQDNPHTLHTGRYVVSGQNSTKFEQPGIPHLFKGMILSSYLRVSSQVLNFDTLQGLCTFTLRLILPQRIK
jgi:hypothetical protein